MAASNLPPSRIFFKSAGVLARMSLNSQRFLNQFRLFLDSNVGVNIIDWYTLGFEIIESRADRALIFFEPGFDDVVIVVIQAAALIQALLGDIKVNDQMHHGPDFKAAGLLLGDPPLGLSHAARAAFEDAFFFGRVKLG